MKRFKRGAAPSRAGGVERKGTFPFYSGSGSRTSRELLHADSTGGAGKASDAWRDLREGETCIQWGSGANQCQYVDFPAPLELSTAPGHYCIPVEMLTYDPPDSVVFKYFFRGTAKEVVIRQIFFYKDLKENEREWLRAIRSFCKWKNLPLRPSVEPLLLRLCYYNWRKFKQDYVQKTYDHLLECLNWRAKMFPLRDTDPDLLRDLQAGAMYWVTRDAELRPLLTIRLSRLPPSTPPARFKTLVVFCFEWALRYLFVPGLVETCTVICDVRKIALHHFPMSALSDLTSTLTKQYPFRLDRMFIINDSLFIQTVWSIAKQFLTEVQQQKMNFMRTGFDKVLTEIYGKRHLEKDYGGTREAITEFYPFPLPPGPYGPTADSASSLEPVPDCYRAYSPETHRGQTWESDEHGEARDFLIYSPEALSIFKSCGIANLPRPLRESQEKRAQEELQRLHTLPHPAPSLQPADTGITQSPEMPPHAFPGTYTPNVPLISPVGGAGEEEEGAEPSLRLISATTSSGGESSQQLSEEQVEILETPSPSMRLKRYSILAEDLITAVRDLPSPPHPTGRSEEKETYVRPAAKAPLLQSWQAKVATAVRPPARNLEKRGGSASSDDGNSLDSASVERRVHARDFHSPTEKSIPLTKLQNPEIRQYQPYAADMRRAGLSPVGPSREGGQPTVWSAPRVWDPSGKVPPPRPITDPPCISWRCCPSHTKEDEIDIRSGDGLP